MTDDEGKKEKREHGDHEHGGTDVNEVREILDVVSEKVPKLLNDLTDVLYGKEQSQKYGIAVAGFYKSLKDAGMTDQQAFELTKSYMGTLNIGSAIAGAIGKHGKDDDDDDDDIKNAINIKIKNKLKEKGLDKEGE